MSDILNRLLHPFVRFFFDKIYPRIPRNDALLWFFAKQYFIEGYDPVAKNWNPLAEKLRAFGNANYNILLNFCTEDAATMQEAARTRDIYIEFIRIINAFRLESSVRISMKMSQFGCFHPDEEMNAFGKKTVKRIIRFARWRGNIGVILDGERLIHAETVANFARAINKKYGNVGVRFQAYNPAFETLLHAFIKKNMAERNIIPVGICKGAYRESAALSENAAIENIIEETVNCAENEYPVAVDTHDYRRVINAIREELKYSVFRNKRPSFGLLYNIKPHLARQLKDSGERVFIYFPVIQGRKTRTENTEKKQWEKFAIRRLIERPLYILYPLKYAMDRLLGKNSYFVHNKIKKQKPRRASVHIIDHF
jgi:hypothetical protein